MNVLQPLLLLLVIFLFSFMVESLTEYFVGILVNNIPRLGPVKPFMPYAPIPIALIGAIRYKFDFIYIVSTWLGLDIPLTAVGIFLTALAIARGSNYIHDLIEKARYLKEKGSLPPVTA